MSKVKHPLQPLEHDSEGVLRFKSNAIVCFLLDAGPYDLNKIAIMDFSQEDREQFAQLIGYSLSGFSELSYVSDETCEEAVAQQTKRVVDGACRHANTITDSVYGDYCEDCKTFVSSRN